MCFSYPLLWEQVAGGLLIGINYFGSSNELHGCVDDVHRMLPLVEQWGFAQEGCSQVLLLGKSSGLANLFAGLCELW